MFANLHQICVLKFGIDWFLSFRDITRIVEVRFYKFFRYISGCNRNFQNPKTASESSSKMLSNNWIQFWKFSNFNPKKRDFLVFFSMVFIKIVFDYYSCRKSWKKKHVKNTQKSCNLHFLGWNLKIFKIELKGSIAFLKTFPMTFLDLKNSSYFQRYFEKTEKFLYH